MNQKKYFYPLKFMKTIQEYIFPGNGNECGEKDLLLAIQNLPLANRLVIEKYFKNNISRKQIAAELSWSLSKVNTKFTRGITLLKHKLNPQYYSILNGALQSSLNISSGNDSEHSRNNSGKQ